MSFYTSPTKGFKFPDLPNNTGKSKKAYAIGFMSAIVAAPLTATEKVAWLKLAADLANADQPAELDPVAGPGPGFVPEGASEEQQVQQLLEALPGETIEDKLHAAAVALLQAQQEEGGEGEGDGGLGQEEGGGELDPALIQQLMQQAPPPSPGAGGPPPPGGPPTPTPVQKPQG